jgi:inosose dehydratase
MIFHNSLSRRDLLVTGAVGLAALSQSNKAAGADGLPVHTITHDDPWRGLKIGVATYSLRGLPLDAAIKVVQRVGLQYVSIKDVHLPMKTTPDERRAIAQKFKDAGLTPLSCGNVGMTNDEANIRAAFEYARDIGLPTMVCAPSPDSLPILDKMVKEFDIKLAIHNHGPEDKRFPAPTDVWKAVQPYDRRIGLCIDVGHSARAGDDPAQAILNYRERLYDLHLKDLANITPKAANVEVGRGVLDIKGILAALLKIGYKYQAAFEYEKDANDPLPGLAESVGFVRGLMAGV